MKQDVARVVPNKATAKLIIEYKDIIVGKMSEEKIERVTSILDRAENIQTIYGNKYTVIILTVGRYEAFGRARRTRDDKYDKNRGISIALFRAIERVERQDRKQVARLALKKK